ncbi:NAD(P)-binding domain-containing protein [Pseudomonas sp. MDT1-17]
MPRVLFLMFASLVLCASQAMADTLKISVIGAGKVGGTLGTLWVKAGHSVMFSSRPPPEELTDLVETAGPNAQAGSRFLVLPIWVVSSLSSGRKTRRLDILCDRSTKDTNAHGHCTTIHHS